jgi:NaMN:DMB phosphoribosyltransferase
MRADAPSGLWSLSEYAKLPPYDRETPDQPRLLFMCHQKDGSLCAGWVGVGVAAEGPRQLLALRLGFALGRVAASVFDYVSPVPLHASFARSAEHGVRDLNRRSARTVRVSERLVRKGVATDQETR